MNEEKMYYIPFMDAKCTVQQITQKKENHHQVKDAVVTIINVITSVMVVSRMLEFMQRKKRSRNEAI